MATTSKPSHEPPTSQRLPRPTAGQVAQLWRPILIAAGGLALALGLLAIIWLFARPLALLVLAIVIAEALAPIVDWLCRRMPRTVAVIIVYLAIFLALAILAWFVLAPLIDQAQDLGASLMGLIDQAQEWIAEGDRMIGAIPLTETLLAQLEGLGGVVAGLPIMLASSLIEIILVVFLSIYWLLAQPGIQRFFLSLFPDNRREAALDIFTAMGQTMGGYVRGVAIVMIILGAMTYIGLALIGVEYALVLGVMTGLLEVIPILGAIMAGVIVVSVTLLQSFNLALITLVFFVFIQQFEGNILVPNVMRTQTDIPALLVLIALVAGGSVGGLLGALVAIPLAGALRVLVVRVLAPTLRRWVGATEPVET